MSTPELITVVSLGLTLLMLPVVVWNLYRADHYMAHVWPRSPRVRWWWCSFCKKDRLQQERVLSRRETERVGRAALERLNRGERP